MADYKVTKRPGNIFNTTAATASQVAATIPSDELGDDIAFEVYARVRAVATDNFDEAQLYHRVGLFLRDGSTLSQIGSTTSLVTIESVGGRDVAFNVNGNDVEVQVSPADTTPLTWSIDLDVRLVTEYDANSGWTH